MAKKVVGFNGMREFERARRSILYTERLAEPRPKKGRRPRRGGGGGEISADLPPSMAGFVSEEVEAAEYAGGGGFGDSLTPGFGVINQVIQKPRLVAGVEVQSWEVEPSPPTGGPIDPESVKIRVASGYLDTLPVGTYVECLPLPAPMLVTAVGQDGQPHEHYVFWKVIGAGCTRAT